MVVYACKPITQETGQEELKFKAILGKILRPCLKNQPNSVYT
jgi:hypothetical protein